MINSMPFLIFETRTPSGERSCHAQNVYAPAHDCLNTARALKELGSPYIALMFDKVRWYWAASDWR